MRSKDYIDGIQVECKYGGKQTYRGGEGGALKLFVLEPYEKITGVEINTDKGTISSLQIFTDMEISECFGRLGESTDKYEPLEGDYQEAIKKIR